MSKVNKAENSACLACDSVDLTFVEEWIGYKLHLCNTCGLTFSIPMKSASDEFYSYDDPYGWRWEFDEFLQDSSIPKGNLLDIGCGDGAFIHAAVEAGFSATGLDRNEGALQRGREKYNLELLFAEDVNMHLINNKDIAYDVISCFHVIEHLADPNMLLKELKTILAPNGLLVLGVPNQSRWQLQYKMNYYDYPPQHLTRWSKSALHSILNKHGYDIVRIKDQKFCIDTFRETVEHIKNILILKFSTGQVIRIRSEIDTNRDGRSHVLSKLKLNLYRKLAEFKFPVINVLSYMFALIGGHKYRGVTLNDEGLYILARLKHLDD